MTMIPVPSTPYPYPEKDMIKMSGLGVIVILFGISLITSKRGAPISVGIVVIMVGIALMADAVYLIRHRE
jgi:hypothetical protein